MRETIGGFFIKENTMSGVNIRVRADATQARGEIGKLERAIVGIDDKATKVTRTFRNLALGITAAFTGGALTKSITKSADSMTNFGNRVNLVTRDVKKTKLVMDELFKISARSRGGVGAAAETFNKFGLALQDANKPVGDLLKVTEAVQKAAVISGSGAESARAAIVQLGQGLAAGQLRGEELNSVLEQMPRLAQAIADGMGVPFGSLKKEAQEGRITAEAVFQAILDGSYEISEEFNTLNATVSGLAQVFGNEWTRAIANLDKVIGTSSAIKDGIAGATFAVQYFGQNIRKWAVLLSSEMLLAKLSVERFGRDILGFFKKIFSAEFDSEALATSLAEGIAKAKEKAKTSIKLSLKFTVEKIDVLKEMFPSLDTALASLRAFKTNVIDIFYSIWDRIVGKSLWTGIFDPKHKESGQSLAIGSSIGRFLKSPINEIRIWKLQLIGLFEDLSFEVYDSWQRTINSIDELGFKGHLRKELNETGRWTQGIVQKFDDMSFEVQDRWQLLTNSVADIGLKPTFDEGFQKAWSKTTTALSDNWDDFVNGLYVETEGEVALPVSHDIKRQFDKAFNAISGAWTTVVEGIKNTTIAITITAVTKDLTEGFDESLEKFNKYLQDSADVSAAIFSGALAVALSTRLRALVFGKALGVAFLASTIYLQDNEEFQESVRSTARGWGKMLGDFFGSEDGDLIGSIFSGLYKLASSIGTGFVDGFFGEDFESRFADSLATGLTLAIGAFVFIGSFRKAVVSAGLTMARLMFGLQFRAIASTKIGSQLTYGFTEAGKKASVAKGAGALGVKMGKLINVGMLAAFAKEGADFVIDDQALGGVGEALDGAIGGAVLGGQIGLMLGGPIGAAVGAAVGGAGGFLIDALNNPELVKKLKGIWDGAMELFDTYVLGLPTIVGDNLKAGFKTAWEWLSGKFESLKNFFKGEGAEAANETALENGPFAKPLKKAEGGPVRGAGTGTSDDIPAMLSTGEFVMQQSAVQKFGPAFMAAINQGKQPVFRSGGGGSSYGDINAGGGTGSFFKNMGLDRQATRLALELTRARADNRKDDANRIVEELQKIYDLNEEQVSLLENGSQEDVAKVLGSDNLEATKTAESYAENFQNAFKQGLSDLLHGGDLKDVLGGLLDTFTSSIIDSFASSFTDAAFENLTPMLTDVFKGIGDLGKKAGAEFDIGGMLTGIADSLKGLFSGGGSSAGGFDLGGTIMKGIGLFTGGGFFASQGGTVPSTPFSQAGKDSVPAMLMPGEVVLSKNQLRNMDSNSSSSTQQFNINVQGDVSRQTRKEIVKMMPQITGGVNSQNKENNHRR